MTVLVIAEHDNAGLKGATLSLVAAAKKLSGTVDILVAGTGCGAAGEAAAKVAGVTKVLVTDDAKLAHFEAEALGHAVAAAVKAGGYTHVLFAAGSSGKAAMPRAAVELAAPAVSEVTDVVSADTFRRFIYAGGVLATVKVTGSPVLMTVRPTAFEPVASEGGSAAVQSFAVTFDGIRQFDFVNLTQTKSDRPDLVSAKRIVAAGRGVLDEAGFAAVEKLADVIGAAVGSTRALVDQQIAPSETQVGQTGKIVAPELYFAFGISGAIQHIAGMKDSKVIVAVNNDAEAPIFEMCDYGLVADANTVVKELTEKLA
ncbi:FAD-binding protein [Duodenibacillus massiliensis]|uniref:electron transfer flavoprotein subunit alpha/FixB family protein n=1 Tax=Duodenibacillus massiliensis TaxID=1852381 RepID=UPI000ED0726D|nr:FAD-binding protein [Duodenibacillus massiliensis]HAF65039.1 electron transfer flavoprotein subunit alpha [Sutterella sp.]